MNLLVNLSAFDNFHLLLVDCLEFQLQTTRIVLDAGPAISVPEMEERSNAAAILLRNTCIRMEQLAIAQHVPKDGYDFFISISSYLFDIIRFKLLLLSHAFSDEVISLWEVYVCLFYRRLPV